MSRKTEDIIRLEVRLINLIFEKMIVFSLIEIIFVFGFFIVAYRQHFISFSIKA